MAAADCRATIIRRPLRTEQLNPRRELFNFFQRGCFDQRNPQKPRDLFPGRKRGREAIGLQWRKRPVIHRPATEASHAKKLFDARVPRENE